MGWLDPLAVGQNHFVGHYFKGLPSIFSLFSSKPTSYPPPVSIPNKATGKYYHCFESMKRKSYCCIFNQFRKIFRFGESERRLSPTAPPLSPPPGARGLLGTHEAGGQRDRGRRNSGDGSVVDTCDELKNSRPATAVASGSRVWRSARVGARERGGWRGCGWGEGSGVIWEGDIEMEELDWFWSGYLLEIYAAEFWRKIEENGEKAIITITPIHRHYVQNHDRFSHSFTHSSDYL